MMTVRGATYDLLRARGMTTVFGNPGSTELGFLHDFPTDFRYVLALHEGVAVGMADGFAQASGRPAFVNLHSACGVGNAMGAVVNAFHNRAPLVITAGNQDRRHLASEPYLFARSKELMAPYVKRSDEPTRAADVPRAIERAWHLAQSPPAGPVFVSVPVDDWDADAEAVPARAVRSGERAGDEAIDEIAALLERSQRPAIVAGAGIDRAGAWTAAVGLAERLAGATRRFPGGPSAVPRPPCGRTRERGRAALRGRPCARARRARVRVPALRAGRQAAAASPGHRRPRRGGARPRRAEPRG
jgi:benzoylformate decarboxylase